MICRYLDVKIPFSCQYHGVKLSIFAAGVNSHRWGFISSFSLYWKRKFCLGRVISLYRFQNGRITEIIEGNPQEIHHSNRLSSLIEIVDGDYLMGQCIYDNDDDQFLHVG